MNKKQILKFIGRILPKDFIDIEFYRANDGFVAYVDSDFSKISFNRAFIKVFASSLEHI